MRLEFRELIVEAEKEAIAELKRNGLLSDQQIAMLRKKGTISNPAKMAQNLAQDP